MGKTILEESVSKRIDERCRRTIFDAPQFGDQTVTQEYEHTTIIDGEQIKAETVACYTEKVSDILDIVIVINGREISAQDVATWMYLLNDNRAECMEKRYFDPAK